MRREQGRVECARSGPVLRDSGRLAQRLGKYDKQLAHVVERSDDFE